MHPDVQQVLDGERSRDDLAAEQLRELEDFEQVYRGLARQQPGAPSWLENRIMVALPTLPRANMPRRVSSWMIEPKPVRLRPGIIGLAMAAALAAVIAWPESRIQSFSPTQGPADIMPVNSGATVFVQFVLASAGAKSVAVSGDFNDWQMTGVPLRDVDGDGVWSGLIALRPGLHKYMFIVDGETWITDPQADRYVDDGFGNRNAVITVTPPPAPRSS